jgi:hypothetical protein
MSLASDRSAGRSSWLKSSLLPFLASRPIFPLLLAVGGIIAVGIGGGEFHFHGDETRHAVTGLFFRDAFVDLPWKDPLRYAYEYYAKYPALGLVFWPPLFHVVEGVFFLVFGISVISSRLAVLSFALVGVYFWYRIAETQGTRSLALLSTFVFPLVPFMLTFERVIMLEVPMMAMCLASIHFWIQFHRTESRRDLFLLSLFIIAAMYTSQKSFFLAFLFAVHFLIKWRFRMLRRWDVWVALLVTNAVVLGWYWFSLGELVLSYERAIGEGFRHISRTEHITFYLELLPEQLGVVLTGLAGLGFLYAVFFKPRQYGLFLLWTAATFFCYTLVQEKDVRHTMIWIPPLVYFALLAVDVAFSRWKLGVWAGAALAAVVAFQAIRFEAPRLGGIEPVVRYVLAQPESDVIYYQGRLDGNFTFFVRKHDPEKRHMVAREKQVVAARIFTGFGKRKILDTPEEFVELLQSWGIRYAVIENKDPYEGIAFVRAALQSDAFERVAFFPLEGNKPHLLGKSVEVYRFKGELRRTDEPVRIPMMLMREDIKVDLKRLAGRPWPN